MAQKAIEVQKIHNPWVGVGIYSNVRCRADGIYVFVFYAGSVAF